MTIEIIRGCMFAGKSEELIRRLTQLKYANQTFIAFKAAIDNRYSSTEIVTHNGCKIPAIAVNNPDEILRIANKDFYDVVAIDETQFFPNNIVHVIATLSSHHRVIAVGLDTDFKGQPFGSMGDLLAIADEDIHLKAVCKKCGQPATRTQRITDGMYAKNNEPTVVIGGSDIYQARCKKCHVVY